ncbi:MAG: SynChlorMet cassette radical SAM/SPASM protein ScmF [Campylobacterota bacterium]|nr:SynChlorMet cassette radical SAM/SPASM protein ScmF [Campylobacterota bacterium]
MSYETIPPLSSLYFYMTEGCNLACQHCWLAPKFDEDGSKYPVIDVGLFRQIIEEAIPLGLDSIKLTGGEPLLHPNIYEIWKIHKEFGLSPWVETNGLLCDEQMADTITNFPSPFVSVSLDGSTPEIHDAIRGLSGAYDRSIQGIKNLVERGVNTQIIFSIMRANIHQYEEIIGIAESLGVDSLKFNIVQPTERGFALHESQRDVTIEEYVKIGKHIENHLHDRSKIRIIYDHPVAFVPLHRLADSSNGGSCGIKHILGVLADGTYALCGIGSSIREMNFGKAGVDRLATIWKNNTVINTIRYDLPKDFTGICARCLMKNDCLGACIAQNYYRTRNLHAPFWYCEEADKKGLFPQSRLTPD